MQMKLLNIALAAALTATLTGCGGDGDAKYNKQTVDPINVGSGVNSTELEKLQNTVEELTKKLNESKKTDPKLQELQDKLNKALSKIEELEKTGSTGETKPTEGQGGETKPTEGQGGETKPTEDELPPVDDSKNNAGKASTVTDVAAVDLTVVQNYVRGEGAIFDRKFNKNPKNTGNATVVGSETLENKVLSNIIIARPKVERGVAQVFAGEGPNDASTFSFDVNGLELLSGKNASLQENNVSIVNYNKNIDSSITGGTLGEEAEDDDIFKAGELNVAIDGATVEREKGSSNSKKVASSPYVLKRTYVGSKLKDSLHGIYNDAVTNGTSVDSSKLNEIGKSAYKSGLVRTLSIGQVNDPKTPEYLNDTGKSQSRPVFIVRGQEDQIIDVKNNRVSVIHDTGADGIKTNDKTRLFGTLSQSKYGYKVDGKNTIGDIPSQTWDSASGKFINNPDYNGSLDKYYLSNGTPNSYQLTADSANADRAAINEIDSSKFADADAKNNALFRAGLTAKPIHLNYVQYGRVTTKADKKTIDSIKKQLDGGAIVVSNEYAEKYRYSNGAFKPEQNTTLDTYFARGLQETKDMPKEGTVEYLGHALTYGLDNSYHKDDAYVSNSIVGTQREGVGNFVRAKADFAKGTVEGNIYNIWTTVGGNNNENLKSKVEEDNLVGFKGDITPDHNSILGESWLEYGDKEKGSFKGSFFGKGAAELGGSVNSVQDGYSKASWGGVFGAQAVNPEKDDTDITAHIENK